MFKPILAKFRPARLSKCPESLPFCRNVQINGIKLVDTGARITGQNNNKNFKNDGGNSYRNATTTTTNMLHPQPQTFLQKSWELHSYGGPKDLQLNDHAKIPLIKNPTDVIIRVMASSLNPIDLAMSKGYGFRTLNLLRSACGGDTGNMVDYLSGAKEFIEFPVVLGRDFAGVIIEMGHESKSGARGLKIGDEVYGVVGLDRTIGSQSEYVCASANMIRKKPKNLNFIEATSLPYVGLTSHAVIHVTGSYWDLSRKRFLVLGGSGGIGTFMIQYLRANGAYVVSTCSLDAIELVSSLGADFVIDYNNPENYAGHIKSQAPFDCILDLTGSSEQPLLYKYLKPTFGQYITLSPPFLRNIDSYGLLGGLSKNLTDLISHNLKSLRDDQVICKWGFFIPNGTALDRISELVEKKMILPVIDQTFKFDELPSAYLKLEQGHLRGKITIDHS